MRWGWLLPDASYEVLYDGWERQSYPPRHGRPPFVIRGAYSAAMVLVRARARYLGAVEDEAMAGAGLPAAVGGARGVAGGRAGATARAVTSSGPGLRAAAGLGAARAGTSSRVGPAANSAAAPRRQRTAD